MSDSLKSSPRVRPQFRLGLAALPWSLRRQRHDPRRTVPRAHSLRGVSVAFANCGLGIARNRRDVDRNFAAHRIAPSVWTLLECVTDRTAIGPGGRLMRGLVRANFGVALLQLGHDTALLFGQAAWHLFRVRSDCDSCAAMRRARHRSNPAREANRPAELDEWRAHSRDRVRLGHPSAFSPGGCPCLIRAPHREWRSRYAQNG